MSRAQLAEAVAVNPQTVGALERGDHYPSLDLAMRICEVFALPVEAVFSRTEFAPLSERLYSAGGSAARASEHPSHEPTRERGEHHA